MEDSLEALFSLGFELAGEWFLDDDQLKFELNRYKNLRRVLYAFVTEDDVFIIFYFRGILFTED
jgi:hypothetical protein